MTTPIRLELPTGFQFGTVNAYLFAEPEPVLVDTGLKSEASWAALQDGLAEHGLTVADLDQLIITAVRPDGLPSKARPTSRLPIWVSPGC